MAAWPVPLLLVGRGEMPAAAVAQLAAATVGVALVEQASGIVPLLAFVLWLQAFAWAAVFAVVAAALIHGLRRVAGRAAVPLAVALVVAGFALATVEPVYRSPFHADQARQALREVYG
jgi:hypothetical protein